MDAFPRPLFRYSPKLDWNARLRLAAAFDDVDTVRAAFRHQANPATPGPEGSSAWEIAVQNQNLHALEALLQHQGVHLPPRHLASMAVEIDFHQGAYLLMQHGLQADYREPVSPTVEEINQAVAQLEATGSALGVQRDENGLMPIPEDGVLPALPIQANSPESLRQILLDAGFSAADPEVMHLADMVEHSPFVVVFHSDILAPYIVVSPEASQRLFPGLAPTAAADVDKSRKPRMH